MDREQFKEKVKQQILQDFEAYWAEAQEAEDDVTLNDDNVVNRSEDFYTFRHEIGRD